MTNFPEWMKTEDNYKAVSDRDGFVGKSVLSVMGTLRLLRSSKTSYGRLGKAFPAPLKLVICLALILCCSISQNMFVTYSILATVLIHVCLLNSESLKKTVSTALLAAFISALILLPAVFLGSPQSMLTVSTKVFTSVSLIGILASTTEWNKLTSGLAAFHIPEIFIFTLDITLKYIVILGDIALDMLNALKLRSVGINKSKSSSLSGILVVTFLKSRQMADEMYDAMTCRGYGDKE